MKFSCVYIIYTILFFIPTQLVFGKHLQMNSWRLELFLFHRRNLFFVQSSLEKLGRVLLYFCQRLWLILGRWFSGQRDCCESQRGWPEFNPNIHVNTWVILASICNPVAGDVGTRRYLQHTGKLP